MWQSVSLCSANKEDQVTLFITYQDDGFTQITSSRDTREHFATPHNNINTKKEGMISLTHPIMWELIITFYGARKEYYTPWHNDQNSSLLHFCFDQYYQCVNVIITKCACSRWEAWHSTSHSSIHITSGGFMGGSRRGWSPHKLALPHPLVYAWMTQDSLIPSKARLYPRSGWDFSLLSSLSSSTRSWPRSFNISRMV